MSGYCFEQYISIQYEIATLSEDAVVQSPTSKGNASTDDAIPSKKDLWEAINLHKAYLEHLLEHFEDSSECKKIKTMVADMTSEARKVMLNDKIDYS